MPVISSWSALQEQVADSPSINAFKNNCNIYMKMKARSGWPSGSQTLSTSDSATHFHSSYYHLTYTHFSFLDELLLFSPPLPLMYSHHACSSVFISKYMSVTNLFFMVFSPSHKTSFFVTSKLPDMARQPIFSQKFSFWHLFN